MSAHLFLPLPAKWLCSFESSESNRLQNEPTDYAESMGKSLLFPVNQLFGRRIVMTNGQFASKVTSPWTKIAVAIVSVILFPLVLLATLFGALLLSCSKSHEALYQRLSQPRRDHLPATPLPPRSFTTMPPRVIRTTPNIVPVATTPQTVGTDSFVDDLINNIYLPRPIAVRPTEVLLPRVAKAGYDLLVEPIVQKLSENTQPCYILKNPYQIPFPAATLTEIRNKGLISTRCLSTIPQATVFIEVDLSGISFGTAFDNIPEAIKGALNEYSQEEICRLVANAHLQQLFFYVEQFIKAAKPGLNIVFEKINLVGTCPISLGGVLCLHGELAERTIDELQMSKTALSDKSLTNLMVNSNIIVKRFYADNCNLGELSELDKDPELFEAAKDARDLTTLSIVNHKRPLNATQAILLAKSFPNLTELFVTLGPKYQLSLEDNILCVPMLQPRIIRECGHPIGASAWEGIRRELEVNFNPSGVYQRRKCPNCQTPIPITSEPLEINPRICRIYRESQIATTWKLELVDNQRKALRDSNWCHIPCGEIFNGIDRPVTGSHCTGCAIQIRDSDLILAWLKTYASETNFTSLSEMGAKMQEAWEERERERRAHPPAHTR